MGSKPTPSLSNIFELDLSSESDDEIVDGSHHMAGVSNRYSSGIFVNGYISAIV